MHSIILTLLFYCPVTVTKALQNFGHTVEAFVSDHLGNTKNTKNVTLRPMFFVQSNSKIFINEPLAQCAVSFKGSFIWTRLWVVACESTKTRLSKLTSGPGRVRERSLTRPLSTKFKSQFKRVSNIKVVVTRAGRLREWSQGGLRRFQGPQNRRIIRNNWRAYSSP